MRIFNENNELELQGVIDFAIEKHGKQKFGELPYFHHLKMVAHKVRCLTHKKKFMEQFGSFTIEQVAQMMRVAYLHDVLKKTDCSIEELINLGLSKNEINAIKLVTKKEGQDYFDYINEINLNTFARIVKIADTLSNLETSISDCNYKFILKYNNQLKLLLDYSS